MEKVSLFDRISRRGVHLPFRGVQPGARGVQIPEGVQSARQEAVYAIDPSLIKNLDMPL